MAVLRRHWKLAVLNGLLVLFALSMCVYVVAQRHALAVEVPGAALEPLDAAGYCRLRELRASAALTALDLASAGCTEQQAEAALTALRSWYVANAARVEAADAATRTAQQSLAEAVRQVNVGPRDEQLLGRIPSLKQSLATAESAKAQLATEAMAAALAVLSPAQAQVLQTAAANAGLPEALRYAGGLSAEQKEAARIAAGKGRPVLAALPAAKTTYDGVLANRQQGMPGVLAAEERVLPLPPELAETAQAVVPPAQPSP